MNIFILTFNYDVTINSCVQLKVLDGKNDRLYQFDGILPEIATNREVNEYILILILIKTNLDG